MILITGGSGFLGKALIKRLKEITNEPIRIVSRNEGNLIDVKQVHRDVEIVTGDITDPFICQKVLKGVDKVYHLAAFKHVGLAESQPIQCTNTNIIGTLNLLKYFRGDEFIAISTDKAAQVAGVYGASKLIMERVIKEYEEIFPSIKYRVVRYGNVLYSTGSVLVKWRDILKNGGEIIVTDPKATRYFWTIDEAIDLIFDCEKNAKDSTPYCPQMKSISVEDLLEAMQQKYGRAKSIKIIGLQDGENLHERVTEDGLTSEEAEKYSIEEIKEMI